MQIPKELPQFEGKRALIFVLGKQSAQVYFAQNGTLEQDDEIEISKPVYSDREGFFKKRGRGIDLGSGSVYESKEYVTESRFLNELKKFMRKKIAQKKADAVYVFVTPYLAKKTEKTIPKRARTKLSGIFGGNYTKHHPTELLKKIAEKQSSDAADPHSEEAHKIIHKTDDEV